MPRVGRHPMKKGDGSTTPMMKTLSITTLVHIPETTGYWENSLKVLDLCLSSIHAHTEKEFDLYVFDNGSCEEVKDYLLTQQKIGQIQFLTFSNENVRKTGGLKSLLLQAEGDIVAYLDSDAYVLPGWLDKSLEILNTFKNVGQVTAIPLARNKIDLNHELLKIAGDSSISISKGNNLIHEDFVRAHAKSVGIDYNKYCNNRLQDREDVSVTKNDISAFMGSVDFQFITTKTVIKNVYHSDIDIPDIRGDDIYIPIWEYKMQNSGYINLSTNEYLVHHMGNKIPDFSKELPWIDKDTLKVVPDSIERSNFTRRKTSRLLQSTRLRRMVKKIHLWTYNFLYEK